MIKYIISLCFVSMLCLPLRADGGYVEPLLSLYRLSPIERAVACIKYFEGWHTKKDYPYCGWGHRIWPGEHLSYSLTTQQADSLLVADLTKLCKLFQPYGEFCLLLAVLAYNVGPYSILGNSTIPESNLIKKIRAGDGDFFEDYLNYCHYKGKFVSSIRRRRLTELLLFLPYGALLDDVGDTTSDHPL